ncbi:MAG: hypothetical protein JSV79_12800 [Armatimonadota bacterium]|nr:MAG: hypothetical protein JSV79_12800 [Armatimonadota bacterium]
MSQSAPPVFLSRLVCNSRAFSLHVLLVVLLMQNQPFAFGRPQPAQF